MPTLADCPALKALSVTLSCSTDSGLIESWVNSVTDDHDHISCFGSPAVARAMKKLNTEAHYLEDMLHDGELRVVGDRLVAFISNSDWRSGRRHFTLAHELGHAALYMFDPELDQSGPSVDVLCNRFAGELLMPTKVVQKIWQETQDADAIVRLAGRTRCSRSAACVRMAEYLDTATTGLASTEGAIAEIYGANLSKSLKDALVNACKMSSADRSFVTFKNGLVLSTRAVDKGRVVFLIHRLRRTESHQLSKDEIRSYPSGSGVRGHAFISYVWEDSEHVNLLQHKLEAAGVQVWRDTRDLWPGEDWGAKIRQAIQNDALAFIACFSRHSLARDQSYQNEEIALAIEQLRRRRHQSPWLMPVRFDDCDIPDLGIGGSRTLRSLQRVDLFGAHFDEGASRLVDSILRILGRPDSQA